VSPLLYGTTQENPCGLFQREQHVTCAAVNVSSANFCKALVII